MINLIKMTVLTFFTIGCANTVSKGKSSNIKILPVSSVDWEQ